MVGRDSAVDIATRYGMHGPGIKSRCGKIFPVRPDRSWGPTNLLYVGTGTFLGSKEAGAWSLSPTSSIAEAKERV
jgi:hypothetical protein